MEKDGVESRRTDMARAQKGVRWERIWVALLVIRRSGRIPRFRRVLAAGGC